MGKRAGGRNPKRLDRRKFIRAYEMLRRGEIGTMEAVKVADTSLYMLETRIRELLQNGYLPGEYFSDGLPMVLDFENKAKVNVRDRY